MQITEIVIIIFGVWLVGLSVVFSLLLAHYNRLIKGVNKDGNLERVLEKILETGLLNSKEIQKIWAEIKNINKEGTLHIQKIGMVRYNPFNETGGSQSFSLAVLNGNFDGFLISGLHARDRTRVYVKPIKNRKSTLELSNKKKKALNEAK